MEMIDVLKKLEEIAQTRPELVADAVDNVSRTNPADVKEENSLVAGKEVEAAVDNKDLTMKEYAGMSKGKSFVDFLKAQGKDIYKLSSDEYSEMAQAYAEYKNATKDEVKTSEGGMSDVHIGAQEALGEFQDEDGNLKMPRRDVVAALVKKSKEMPFPDSYEYETAARMAADDFDDNGQKNADMEPAMDSEQPAQEPEATEGNEFSQAVVQAKASGMKAGDKFKVGDKEHTLRDSDFEQVNTDTMKTEKTEGKIPAGLKAYQDKKAGKEDKKETVKEAVQISTDSPQEASMMMQLLKLAGVQPVDQAMINQEPEHGSDMDPGALNKQMDVPDDDAMGSMQMGRMRDMMTAPAEEKAEETFANSMGDEKEEPKYQDTDTLVNFHSGGLNSQKQQVRKEYPGDNPLAVKEDTVNEEDLANSLRTQYEGFKSQYQEATKKAKPDFLDMDKDGDKKEPMKKAVKDKEAK
jgi:hypothetical protein